MSALRGELKLSERKRTSVEHMAMYDGVPHYSIPLLLCGVLCGWCSAIAEIL